MCMSGVQRGQKTLLDPLELGFQMTVNCHLGAGDQTLVLARAISMDWSHLSSAWKVDSNHSNA